MKINSIINNLLIGSAILLMAGCNEEKYALRFSHDLHVTENGMDCSDCHGAPGEGFKKISHETCADCHDEVAAEEVDTKTCGMCHQEKQLPGLKDWKAGSADPGRSIFVHTEALAGKCQECHSAIMAKDMANVPNLQRADIVKIRNAAHASGQDCLMCHVDMDRSQRPGNHDVAWTKRHGVFGMQDDAACNVCHSEDSCKECHSVMQPASHNNIWRMHSHGAVASWNRASCMVCHEQDSCQSCHAETRPRSHTARWDAPGKKPTHCIGCHTSASAGEGCVVCHENGNDLLLHASFWPAGPGATPPHDLFGTAISCYECHWTTTP